MKEKQKILSNEIYKDLQEYILFLKRKRFNLYSEGSVELTIKLDENKVGYKMSVFSGLMLILYFSIISIYILIFQNNINIFHVIILHLFMVYCCKTLERRNREKTLSKIYDESKLRYIGITTDYKFIVAQKCGSSFTIESVYNHLIDRYITNIGSSTCYKVMDENKNIIEYYELISKYANNHTMPYYVSKSGTSFNSSYNSYWSVKKQLKYYEKHGCSLRYVDDYFIINNSNPRTMWN